MTLGMTSQSMAPWVGDALRKRKPPVTVDDIRDALEENVDVTCSWLGQGGFGEVLRVARKNCKDVAVRVSPCTGDQSEPASAWMWETRFARANPRPDRIVEYHMIYHNRVIKDGDGDDGDRDVVLSPTATVLLCEPHVGNASECFRRIRGTDRFVRVGIQFLEDATRALKQLHAMGLVHNDCKPANFFEKHDGSFVLGDPGSAFPVDKRFVGPACTRYVCPPHVFIQNEAAGMVSLEINDWGSLILSAISLLTPHLIIPCHVENKVKMLEAVAMWREMHEALHLIDNTICPCAPYLKATFEKCKAAQPRYECVRELKKLKSPELDARFLQILNEYKDGLRRLRVDSNDGAHARRKRRKTQPCDAPRSPPCID